MRLPCYLEGIRGNRADNLKQALTVCEKALQVHTYEAFPEQWAMTQNNLGLIYLERVELKHVEGEKSHSLKRAIEAFQEALRVRTRDALPQQWAATQNNLALAYLKPVEGGQDDNIERAITACEEALQIYTQDAFPEKWARTQNNLALAYSKRIQRNRAENLERAIAAYKQALQVFTPDAFPKDCQQAARYLGTLYFEKQAWSEATNAYITALDAADILYQSCIFLDGKAAELRETADLPRLAAYARARRGDLKGSALTLELGRARGLSETLKRDRADLRQFQRDHAELFSQYQHITAQIRNLEAQDRLRMTSKERHNLTPRAHRTLALDLRQQFKDLLQEIRQVPDYETFLNLPTFDDISCVVGDDRPLVYLIPTSAGSLALIVTIGGIEPLWLDNFSERRLKEILSEPAKDLKPGGWFGAFQNFRRDSKVNYQGWCKEIECSAHQLWEPLMFPLIQLLKAQNFHQAILIPTGLLSFLPLHAAWTEDPSTPTGKRYALDDIHFTYAPNAQSLTAATAIANRTTPASILAIDNPTQNLKNSEREVQSAIASFPQHTVLKHAAATVEKVRSQLPHADIVHFSCHGTANLNDPLNSGLLMSDGLLTLKDIFALKLGDRGGIRLAILSACETGLAGIENADEAISLPTGLLQAGVAGVVASLWSVSDLSTMMLLTRFYDLWRNDKLEPAIALRQAQQWLRDTPDGEKAAYFGLVSLTPNARNYAHPFYWEAFNYTGV